MERTRFDGLTIVALALLVFMGYNVLRDRGLFPSLFDSPSRPAAKAAGPAELQAGLMPIAPAAALPAAAVDLSAAAAPPAAAPAVYDPNAIFYPYSQYTLTQGPHGVDYGHLAIDLTAGNGAAILSPIHGVVSAVFIDEYNNTNLIIENERYTVTMLHGNYAVHTGETIAQGQQVGTESNNGYTIDAYGQLCAGRDCGYHTHLNVYDKQSGANANPLDILKPLPPSGN